MRKAMFGLLFFVLLMGCGENVSYKVSTQKSPYHLKDFNTSMRVTLSSSYQEGKLIITVINDSPYEILFGEEYLLEKRIDKEWRKMLPADGQLAFKDPVYTLKPNKKFAFKAIRMDLKSGTYRLIKRDLSMNGSKEDFIISHTFTVKN